MASLFVSHSSKDRAWVENIRRRLEGEGYRALFIDYDPELGIPAGRNWERELYAQLQRTQGLIFVGSDAARASRWCFAELTLARSVGKPIFPLLVDGDAWHPLLRDTQWIDVVREGEAAFDRLWSSLRRQGFDPADAFAWHPDRTPFPGLRAFAPEDAAVFFGREDLIEMLLETLNPGPGRRVAQSVAVVGPSGSGKSSLVRAGIIPRLRRAKDWVVLDPFPPGNHPLTALARSLAAALPDSALDREQLEARIRTRPAELAEITRDIATGQKKPEAPVLLVVDQAEELTLLAPEERDPFLDVLIAGIQPPSPLWLVLTLRSEFLGPALEDSRMAELVASPIVVGPLPRSRLAEVIEGPAQRAGLRLEPGLVERMVEETVGGDALPLLAFTLRQVYERRSEDGLLSAEAYRALGGVEKALEMQADRVLEELRRATRAGRVMECLTRFVTVTARGEATRRRVPLEVLDADETKIVRRLVDARLLSTDDEGDQVVAEVVHEALLRNWPPLRQAIEQRRDELIVRSEVEREASGWQEERWDPSVLPRGSRRARFIEWGEEHAPEAMPLQQKFLEALRAARTSEFDEAKRRASRLRRQRSALGVMLALAVVAAGIAVLQTRQARTQARIAASRGLAGQAVALGQKRPDMALLMSLQAFRLHPTSEARSALATVLAQTDRATFFYHDQGAIPRALAFSPDNKLLAWGDDAGSFAILDLGAGRPLVTLPKTKTNSFRTDAAVSSVAFSPNGQMAAYESEPGKVTLWDIPHARPLGAPVAIGQGSATVAFGAEGKSLVAVDGADRVAVSDPTSRQSLGGWELGCENGVLASGVTSGGTRPIGPPDGNHPLDIRERPGSSGAGSSIADDPSRAPLAFTAKATAMACVKDGAVSVWGIPGGQALGHIEFPGGAISLALAPDGGKVAVGLSNSVVLLDLKGRSLGSPLDTPGGMQSLAFSPDGTMLAEGAKDGSVVLWDVTSLPMKKTLVWRHAGPVEKVSFSPDGKSLASASDDGMIAVWSVGGSAIMHGLVDALARGEAVYLSPDGKTVIAESKDGAVTRWRLPDGEPLGQILDLATLPTSPPAVPAKARVALISSILGGRVLALQYDGGIVLWDETRRRVLLNVPGDLFSFDPAGTTLAAGDLHGATITFWDVASGKQRYEPLQVKWAGFSFVQGGRRLAISERDGSIGLFDVGRTNPVAHTPNGVFGAYLSPTGSDLVLNGPDLALSGPPNVSLWRIPVDGTPGNPVPIAVLPGTPSFSSDGTRLAISDFEGVHLVNLGSSRIRSTLIRIPGCCENVSLSPDGTTLAATVGQNILLFDGQSGTQLGQLRADDNVTGVAFAPDGKTLASGQASSIILWDVAGQRRLGNPLDMTPVGTASLGARLSFSFSPGGRSLAVVGLDNSLTIWNGLLWTESLGTLKSDICNRVPRSLNAADVHEFLANQHQVC